MTTFRRTEEAMRKLNLLTTSTNSFLSQPKKGVQFMSAKRIFLTFVVAVMMTAMVTGVDAQSTANGLDPQGKKHSDLTGSWIVNVNPEGIPPFENLSTFTRAGSILNTPETGSESVGHGTWVKTGNHQFASTFKSFLYDEAGQIAGKGKVRATVTLNKSADEFSGPFIFEAFDLNGNVVFSAPGTVHAIRINVESLP
jgi:hypothetical protein